MEDPRELARQALSMLQSALADSETRAQRLSEELARKPVSKDKLASQVDVLAHRLENVEAECGRWKHEAEQLEDVLANERAKLEGLRNKLEVAESGPDKLTKKEINYWRASAGKVDAKINAYKSRIAALNRELRDKSEQLEAQQPGDRPASDARAPARFQAELDRARQEAAELRASLQLSQAELHELHRVRENLAIELNELKRRGIDDPDDADDRASEHDRLAAQLEQAQSRESSLRAELQATRDALADREQQLPAGAVPASIANAMRAELERTQHESSDLRAALERSETKLMELRDTRESLAAELAEFHRRRETERTAEQERSRRLEALEAELEDARERASALRAELDDTQRVSAGQAQTAQALNDAVRDAEREAEQARDQIVELQNELKEEREYSENLSELANGRLDQINKLQDNVEEARERLDDALWRLEKARHFERLVIRRKSLIASLIAALRTKNKATVALKAGLDGLRRHKARVEETQQRLLMRLEALKSELQAARNKIRTLEAEAGTVTAKKLADSQVETTALHERLTTQAQLIQSLEEELKTARAHEHDTELKNGEVTWADDEPETESTIIARLRTDLDEQQRELSELRGKASEIRRLKAATNKDRNKIDILERENVELRAMIESAEYAQAAAGDMTDERELELQAKIAELNDAVAKWKKKYEFLSAEAPAAYQAQPAAKS